ncbi:MAG: hypothetical protein BGO03_09555 [Mesorhizobium sp. 61-13]|nr:MAG: hypothetical protein BGO03_09555 [Mesorhizobium sp. 61-13]
MKDDIIRNYIDRDLIDTAKETAESIGDYVADANRRYVDVATDMAREAGNLAVSAHNTLVDSATGLAEGVEQYASEAYSSLKAQFASSANAISGAEAQAITMTAEEAFKNLPATSACDMPPEVQSLIEVKMSEELFRQHFEELKEQGSLREVMDFLKSQPLAEEPATTATPDIELDRNSPAVANRLPSLG